VRSLLNCFWTLLLSLPLCGQEYSYVNYTTREGLAGSMVYFVTQDRDGFMWFGTEHGLSRFDGTRFKNYTTADGLPDNDVLKVFVDSKNRVWIIPFKNAIAYYWQGKIYNADNDSLLSKLSLRSEIIAMTENARAEIMMINHRQVIVIKPDGEIRTFEKFEGMDLGSGFNVGLKDKNTLLASISCGTGFFLAEYRNDSLVRHKFWLKTFAKYPAYLSADLEIYRGYDSIGIYYPRENRTTMIVVPEGFNNASVLSDSLVVLCGTSAHFYNVKRNRIEQTLLKDKEISGAYRDHENNIWFASLGKGVFRLASGEFRNYVCKSDDTNYPVWSLYRQNDSLLAGTTQQRLWTFNMRTGTVSNQQLTSPSTLGRIKTFHSLPDNVLLVGTDETLFTIRGKKILKRSPFNFAIKSVHVSSDTILIGTNIGVFKIDRYNLDITDTLWKGRVTAMLKKNSSLYIGTLNGLLLTEGGRQPVAIDRIHPALKTRIAGIQEDKKGIIWVATGGSGIVGMQGEKVIAWLRSRDGMTSDICQVLYLAGDTVWVGTEKGLNRIIETDGNYKITKYSASDGLIDNSISTVLVQGNSVFVGTPLGISHFEQDKVSTYSTCYLQITAIRSPKHLWQHDTTGLDFGHWENDIRFEFVGISFKSAGEITYRYRLKGLNDEWQETTDNFLSYLSLPSGEYELELQATNKFGVQSELMRIQFTIAKLLWEKNWFRFAAILLLAVLVWKYVQYRIRKVRKQAEAQVATSRKITELEQMALKAQMNPHFIFNCLHSIQQFVIDKDTRGANKFITDFARLIRLTLDISSQPKISLAEEINYISTYLELEKSKYEDKFAYEVEVREGVDENSNYIPAMILQPYVENSIRHGIYYRKDNNGKIDITFSKEGMHLVCVIADNGVGRKVSKKFKEEFGGAYQSKGMSLTYKRIELLNGNYDLPILADIDDVQDNGEIKGTRVTLRFPLEEAKKPI
jgi:ligand-binding sensor domain-containing protein